MRIVRHLKSCPEASQGCVVALGNFDGVHLGHQALLKRTIETAKKLGTQPAVLTFEPHPVSVIKPAATPLRLTPFHLKAVLLRSLGVKVLYVARFNKAFSQIEAEDFVRDFLHTTLKAKHVITGENFIFGHNRKGDSSLLMRLSETLGFGYTAMKCAQSAEGQFSSSLARDALKSANLPLVKSILGREHIIEGRVRRGKQLGKTLGFPTANIYLKDHFRPSYGIYCVECRVEDTLKPYSGVASLGLNPMYPEQSPVLEAHLFDSEENLYGKRLQVRLLKFLRPEKRFDSQENLIKQMKVDYEQAKQYFAHSA